MHPRRYLHIRIRTPPQPFSLFPLSPQQAGQTKNQTATSYPAQVPPQQTQAITSAATTTPTTPTNEAPFTPAPPVAVVVGGVVPLPVAVPVPVRVPVPVPVSVDVDVAVAVEVDVKVVDEFGGAGFRTSAPPNTAGGDTAVDALAARIL